MINQNINANYCLTKTSVNNQNKLYFSLKHVFQNSFPSIKYHWTTTKEIENIINHQILVVIMKFLLSY